MYFKDGNGPPPLPVLPSPEDYKKMGKSGRIKFRNLLVSRLRMGLHHQLDQWLAGPGREDALIRGVMAGAAFQIRVDLLAAPDAYVIEQAQRYAAADVADGNNDHEDDGN